jgi:hypothetical protein
MPDMPACFPNGGVGVLRVRPVWDAEIGCVELTG